MVVRTALVSWFFNGPYTKFFSEFTQNFVGRFFRTALYLSTGLFSSEATPLKKTLFTLYFTFWVGFYRFLAKFFSKVVRAALVSRFSIGFMSFFFELCANFVSWSVRTALHVSTGLCLWEASSLKKKHFSNCISLLGRKHFRFSANLFQHGNQNCIGF